jgi:hypothetical protein
LCVGGGAPPVFSSLSFPGVQPLGVALPGIPATHVAVQSAAPLPPRGPPSA